MIGTRPMRRLLPLFACLMLVLTSWSGVAHAVEAVGCSEMSASEVASHVDGDGDQVPSDDQKGYPHHHAACHGHPIGTPVADDLRLTRASAARRFASGRSVILAGHHDGPALRPPQA